MKIFDFAKAKNDPPTPSIDPALQKGRAKKNPLREDVGSLGLEVCRILEWEFEERKPGTVFRALSIKEVAKWLGISPRRARRLIKNGLLSGYRVRNQLVTTEQHLEDYCDWMHGIGVLFRQRAESILITPEPEQMDSVERLGHQFAENEGRSRC